MIKIYKIMLLITLLFGVVIGSNAQQTVSGKVSDVVNDLPGVSVLLKGTTTGTLTDLNGNYSINAKKGETLVFSFVGFESQEIVIGNSNIINVVLEEDDNTLNEIVVVAYGTSTKEAFTGAASVVGAKDIEGRVATSPLSAIEGKATGVQFVSASGQPGSSPSIVIRGVGTLNGSTSPLFIIDGIQFEGGLSSINQDDIESMTVLKGAGSTSLYGSRAANGVVIITTKKGKGGGIKVNASTQYGVVTKGIGEYDYVNPGQYYELMWEAYKNTLSGDDAAAQASANIFGRLGYNPFDVANDEIVGVDGVLNPNANLIYEGLNWYDALERQGSRKNHSINLSGGGENHSIFLSGSYLQEDGYVIESNYDRLTTRLNADFTPKKWLNMGGSVNIASSNSHGPSSRSTSIANPFGFAKNMGSIYPVYVVDNDGKIVTKADGTPQFDYGEGHSEYGIQSRPSNPGRHAIAEAILNEEVTKINNLGFRGYSEFKFFEGLSAKLTYGQDIQDYTYFQYENDEVGDGAPTGRYQETRFRRTVQNFNQILNYYKTFNDVHNVDIIVGHESYDRHYSELEGIANTQTAAGIYEFDNFSAGDNLSGYSSDYRLEGYFSRLNYNYDNKYYASASFRRDGSSVFHPDVRWGNFYSLGGSWRIDQESFMDNVSFVNGLKLRASYGQIGNDDLLDFYISQPRYDLTSNAGNPGILWTKLGNAGLKWETVESWDVALEFGLFNNFLDGAIEFYRKTSSDLLYNVPIPLSNGLNEKPENIGDMYNQGIELSLTGHLVNRSNFNWDLSVQASTLHNKITKIPSPFINGSKRWEEGRSIYDYFLYHYAGVDSENGDALYYMYEPDAETGDQVAVLNEDGSHKTTNDYQDAQKAYANTNSVPKLIGSFSNGLRYKNLGLNFMFVFGVGGDILDYGYSAMMHEGEFGESLHPDALNAWRNPGDITDVPRLENGNPNQNVSLSTRYLTDASYLALRNVNLNYNIPSSFTDKLGIAKLQVFATGENLFLKSRRTGLNPQYNLSGTPSGNDYNPSRVVSLGLNVSL